MTGKDGMTAALVVGCAGFLQSFDGNAVAVALPAMAHGFGVPALALGEVITAYLVGAAAALPLCGWLAERIGARPLFLAAIALFALTSVACGAANGVAALEGARLVQGCSGALLLPVGRIIVVGQSTSRETMLRAMGVMTTPVILGPLLAPPIGGLIVTVLSWRWLFLLNVPIALVGMALVARYVPRTPRPTPRPFDLLGTALLSSALAMATYGVSLAVVAQGRMPGLALIAAGLVATGGYLLHARRHAAPALPPALFARRTFAASNVGGIFPRMLVSAVPFLLTLQFQVGFGLSAAGAGGLVFASALGSLPARWLIGPLVARWSYRRVLAVNAVLIALSVAACALFTAATPRIVIMTVLALQGLIRSTQLVAMMAMSYSEIAPPETPAASTIASLSQQVAMSIGIAVAVAAVELGGGGAIGVQRAFVALGIVSLLSLLWTWGLPGRGAIQPRSITA
jgi:MFS family permease